MRLLALVLLAGCAATGTPAAKPVAAAQDPLQERAAELFDAATHGDELRLKTLVDWARWRTVDGLVRSDGEARAAEVLSRMEAEPAPTARFVDDAVRDVRARLAEVAAGTLPPRPRSGVMNATLAAWRRGPAAGAPPSLARLQTLAAEALDGGREVTYDGARRVTLVFVGSMLAGVLEAR
jgi:hypothetical protein